MLDKFNEVQFIYQSLEAEREGVVYMGEGWGGGYVGVWRERSRGGMETR